MPFCLPVVKVWEKRATGRRRRRRRRRRRVRMKRDNCSFLLPHFFIRPLPYCLYSHATRMRGKPLCDDIEFAGGGGGEAPSAAAALNLPLPLLPQNGNSRRGRTNERKRGIFSLRLRIPFLSSSSPAKSAAAHARRSRWTGAAAHIFFGRVTERGKGKDRGGKSVCRRRAVVLSRTALPPLLFLFLRSQKA